ncbi:MAG TPA: hypothetical protein VJ908_10065 [Wenzhouxiangellaceae bacterium]|nr:hypothetical protein [Wenzhouxiangellaceae bacterium]
MSESDDTGPVRPHRKTPVGLVTRTGLGKRGRRPFWDQVNNNLVALISLVLAITSLGYNTWRNEKTEIQRNWRQASFQILVEVGELNQIILMRRYFPEVAEDSENRAGEVRSPQTWVAGWGKATMIRDLTTVMPEPMPEAGQRLFETWQEHADDLDDTENEQARETASSELLDAVEHLRSSAVELIGDLS